MKIIFTFTGFLSIIYGLKSKDEKVSKTLISLGISIIAASIK